MREFLRPSQMHEAQMEQLTGCRYAVIVHLAKTFEKARSARGRPPQNGPLVTIVLALMKLRLNVSLRVLEALTGIDSVTLSRCVNRSLAFLGTIQFRAPSKGEILIVDTTSTRVASTQDKSYSGYKHHKCAKAQVIVTAKGRVLHVSDTHAGSVHDKTIWNKEITNIPGLIEHLILADKAYAGAKEEVECLLRPVKKGETAYRDKPQETKEFNRTLSKTRVKVEHVFARLKSWRALQGLFAWRADRYAEIVKAVSVLYNLNLEFAS